MRAAKLSVTPLLLAAVLFAACAPAETPVEDDEETPPAAVEEVVESSFPSPTAEPTPTPTPEVPQTKPGFVLDAVQAVTDPVGYSYSVYFRLELGYEVLDSSMDAPGETSGVFPIRSHAGVFTNLTAGDYDLVLADGRAWLYPVLPARSELCGLPPAFPLPSGDCIFLDSGSEVSWDPRLTVPAGQTAPATPGDSAAVLRIPGIPEADAGGWLGSAEYTMGLIVVATWSHEPSVMRPSATHGFPLPTECSFDIGEPGNEYSVLAQTPWTDVCEP